jgi:hypothetical protein
VSGFSAILWRSALLGASLLIAWQVVRFGLAAHYAKQVEAGDGDAVEQVLRWRSNHPFALYAKGLAMAGDDPRSASELFERAYMANPTDSRPLLALAEVHLEAGRVDEADALMRMVDRLTPVHPFIQRRLARYWGERDETPTALRHLSKAMAGDDNIAREGFPLMLQLAEDPVQRGLLEPFALERPRWWPEFFRYASYRARSTDSLRYLIALRSRPDAPELTRKERVHYQDRLLRDGFAAEAYLTWLNTLDPDERRQVGLIFDGGFELPFTFGRVTSFTLGSFGSVSMRNPSDFTSASMRVLAVSTSPSMMRRPRSRAFCISERISRAPMPRIAAMSATTMANSQVSPPGRVM